MTPSRAFFASVVLSASLVSVACRKTSNDDASPVRLRVAAASDLSAAFTEVAAGLEAESGVKVDFTFGSSGLLAKQVAEGAPFDAFASANVAFADSAVQAGVCDASTQAPYARGRLVLYCPSGIPSALAGLEAPAFRTIAIASPDHAPYGKAAMDALERAGLASKLKPRLVVAGNVAESLQFARSGNADCAFVSKALVRELPASQVLELPMDTYTPIVQSLVLCRGPAGPLDARRRHAALAFSAFVTGPRGQAILTKYGFDPPPTGH